MEVQKKFRKVYDKYCKERLIEMDETAFASLITTYPALLVALADGKVDNNEKLFLMSTAKSLAESFQDEQTETILVELLSYQYFTEFDYLLKNPVKWKKSFLDLLAEYLNENIKQKSVIKKMILGVAKASNDICIEEQNVIKELNIKLNLN